MAFFRRRKDPLEARAQELAGKIKRLERELREAGRPAIAASTPRPAGAASRSGLAGSPVSPAENGPPSRTRAPGEPLPRIPGPATPRSGAGRAAGEAAPDPLLSPVGARKFDLPAAWRRWIGRFTSHSMETASAARYRTSNSIHGLRPLRYEKRVARNRFIGLFVLLVLVLTGLARVYVVNLR